MERLIFHVDVNSAYLSWESARRVSRGEPDLRLIPAAIGGDREKRTGIILAKSIPAKKCGVKTGEPVGMALRKCPELVLACPDFQLYEASSQAFMKICGNFAPVVEKFSIDECFLDMSGTHLIYPDPVATAHKIKDTIKEQLGFTVNIGIGNCKLLAKMAGDFEKPDKVHTLFPEEIPEKMWPLPVGALLSVGHATAQRLEEVRIRTIGDLAHTSPIYLQKLLGAKMGRQLHDYANGIDLSPVLAVPEEAKGYSISTTTQENVTTVREAQAILLALTDSVTARMRADCAKASCVGITLRSNRFQNRCHQKKLTEPTDISREVYTLCCQLFEELWDGVTPLRLLGISLTGITKQDCAQMSLFPDERREKARKLDSTYDAIHRRFGRSAIVRGSDLQSGLDVGKKYAAQIDQKLKK